MEGNSFLYGAERLALEDGTCLRLLSAWEALEAHREAEALAQGEKERALCANACLLARALERDGAAVFGSGAAVLAGLTPRRIGALARQWAEFDREENPGAGDGEERCQALKKAWSTRRRSACAGACSGPLEPCPPKSGFGQ